MSTEVFWPSDTSNPVSKTIVDRYEVSTIVVNLFGEEHGETVVFDLDTGGTVAEQRCDADYLTARIQHEEWVLQMRGNFDPGSTPDYQSEGRGPIYWTFETGHLRAGHRHQTRPAQGLPDVSASSDDAAGGLDLVPMVRYAESEARY